MCGCVQDFRFYGSCANIVYTQKRESSGGNREILFFFKL